MLLSCTGSYVIMSSVSYIRSPITRSPRSLRGGHWVRTSVTPCNAYTEDLGSAWLKLEISTGMDFKVGNHNYSLPGAEKVFSYLPWPLALVICWNLKKKEKKSFDTMEIIHKIIKFNVLAVPDMNLAVPLEHSYQGLHCLPFHLHLLDTLLLSSHG